MNDHYYQLGVKLAVNLSKPPPRWAQNRDLPTQTKSEVERPNVPDEKKEKEE
jgi:hypothetical protein